MKGLNSYKWVIGYIFSLPILLFYFMFKLIPLLLTILYSFTNWRTTSTAKEFIGLSNYAQIFRDKVAWEALYHNLVWIIIGTITPILIGLALSLAIWKPSRLRNFFRTVYFLPCVLSLVAIGIIWDWLYNPLFGPINTLLQSVGLGSLARGWLGDPKLALISVLISAIWVHTGFCFVILFAGLQNVDMELIDAAKIDGANSWQTFLNVTLPQMASVLTMLTTYTLIGGFNVFDIVFVMTNGGPGTSSEVIGTYTYRKAFMEGELGYGSALSVIILLLSLVASYLFIKLRERREE